ncbi:MAG TPA: ABC transporter substrate-binding protein [Candidatus Binataceae bacterium]|nr:ABC transporter substrate-binding protein [Candidatus Binataceae bacterium]
MRTNSRIKLVAALLSMVAIAACHVNRIQGDHAQEQNLYQAEPGDPRTFNPILITDATSGETIGDLFEGLVRTNPLTTLPEGELAENWEISKDEKTVTFHLRRGVKWFDGQPLTARDFLFSMKVVYDPKIATSIRSVLLVDGQPIASSAPDDHTIVLKLPRPFAPLLSSAGGVPIIPEHVLAAAYAAGKFNQTWGINTAPDQLVGTGAFRMTRYVPSQVVQYVRNPDFWMKDEQGGELPRLRAQTRMIVQDLNAAYLRFLSGQTDLFLRPRPEEVIDLRDQQQKLGITVREIGIDTGSLFFCFNRNPHHFVKNGIASPKLAWFTDLNFLRAMAHAVDKDGIVNLCFHGFATPAVADISPANKIFHNPDLKDYDYDLSEAARLLEAGGYHLVSPGVRVDSKGNRLEFNLVTNTGTPERDQMCAIFKQDLGNLGIKVNYRPIDFITLVEKLDSNFDWDCVLMGFTGGIEPNDGANFYRSSGNLHLWNPNQPKPATEWEGRIDLLLDQGAAEMDTAKRAPYYWEIQKILHDQLAIIQTVRQIRYHAWVNTLENYQPTVWGTYKPEWIQFKPQ